MKFWALVGDANSRKSSAVRGLTGAGRRQPDWRVRLSAGREVITFVEISAPQEREDPLKPADFVQLVSDLTKKLATTHVIVPLRHDPFQLMPAGIDYVDHFVRQAGWRCLGVALTGDNRSPVPFRQYDPNAFAVAVNHSPYDAPNAVAQQLRSVWAIA